jgi:hypothetical protein
MMQICLHAANDSVYSYSSQGLTRAITSSFSPGIYRVLGTPCNYRLLLDLYSAIKQHDIQAQVLVGKPLNEADPAAILQRLTLLQVQDNLPQCWHRMDSQVYNHFLLLHTFKTKGYTDNLHALYSQHCLHRYLKFSGIRSIELGIELLAEIGDPRWYINPERPDRVNRLHSYFKVLPNQLKSITDGQHKRNRLLMNILSEMEPTTWLMEELGRSKPNSRYALQACRKLLNFLAYNWLQQLNNQSVQFDPALFFQSRKVRQRYAELFRS